MQSTERGDAVLSNFNGSSNTRGRTGGSVAILGDQGKSPVLDFYSDLNGKSIAKLLVG